MKPRQNVHLCVRERTSFVCVSRRACVCGTPLCVVSIIYFYISPISNMTLWVGIKQSTVKRFLRTSYDDVKGRTSVNVDGNSGEEKKNDVE